MLNNPNSWIEINSKNLISNIQQFKNILDRKTKISAVVKSNAYGHGIIQVSKIIQHSIDMFCVVNLEEALLLRKNNIRKPILVLSYFSIDKINEAILKNISVVIYNFNDLKKINNTAKKIKKNIKLHLKIETGTARLGVGESELNKIINYINNNKFLKLDGVFSHLAASEENQKYTELQIDKFDKIIKKIENRGVIIKNKHIACSAAAIVNSDSHYNMIRLGIGMYGLWPSKLTRRIAKRNNPKFNLKPVLVWKTKIIQIKNLKKGDSVGYGCTHITKKNTKIAVLSVGYFEGYDRNLSNNGEVLISGKKCKIIGRICMNLCMCDINHIKNCKVGDEAVLIGKQKNQEITAEELAEKSKTINYEVVARINPNLLRNIIK